MKESWKQFSKFSTQSKCSAYTLKLGKTEIVKAVDYTSSGEKKETYVCQHCGEVFEKTITISKEVHYTSSDGGSYSFSFSSGRSYSSHSSSRSFGGAFGGGRSDGGGYFGRW